MFRKGIFLLLLSMMITSGAAHVGGVGDDDRAMQTAGTYAEAAAYSLLAAGLYLTPCTHFQLRIPG